MRRVKIVTEDGREIKINENKIVSTAKKQARRIKEEMDKDAVTRGVLQHTRTWGGYRDGGRFGVVGGVLDTSMVDGVARGILKDADDSRFRDVTERTNERLAKRGKKVSTLTVGQLSNTIKRVAGMTVG